MKVSEQKQLLSAVEVGGWKLEHDKEKAIVVAGSLLAEQVARLVEVVPIRGERKGVIWDLIDQDKTTGKSLLFSLRTDSYNKKGLADYKEIDLRIGQGVQIDGEPYKLDTIVLCEDFRRNLTFVGGRKIQHWGNQGIRGLFAAPAVPEELPVYDTVDDFLPDLETLCPITGEGIADKLARSFHSVE